MAKVIDKGLGTKDDPNYSDALMIGPIRVFRKSTKDGKPEKEDKPNPQASPSVPGKQQ